MKSEYSYLKDFKDRCVAICFKKLPKKYLVSVEVTSRHINIPLCQLNLRIYCVAREVRIIDLDSVCDSRVSNIILQGIVC